MAAPYANPIGSSSGERRWSYDVFLSFRGADTQNSFVAPLLASLHQKGIHTFIDDMKLERGEWVGPVLSNAIEGSRIAVAIFSENYASSTWCLEELSKIIECTEWRGQTLIPIFWKVEPSVVRRQASGPYRTALEKHEERFKDNLDKVKRWRDALRRAANQSGECFNNGNEADFAERIAQLVSEKVGRQQLLDVAKNTVGLDSEIEKVKLLLSMGEPEVHFIGIVGMGGIGKTTLAKAIYNQFVELFEGCSFLANVREKSRQDGLVQLQKQLLSDIHWGQKIDVSNVASGISFIKQRLQKKKCLIVLDDVDEAFQIDALAGGCDWFGKGSRIIVTTRGEHVLKLVGASIHRMETLSEDHARELLSWSAFGRPSAPTYYATVFSDVLDYAKGHPLALRVFGSLLYGRDVLEWEDTVRRLKDFPNRDILKVLKLSYDSLDYDTKAIFLHIACFFNQKKKDDVVKILNGCGYQSEFGIEVLHERSLLTVQHGRMHMHDLIEEMGKDIARREKSMLWTLEKIRSVLEDNVGTDAIQAIYLKNYNGVPIHLNPKAFEKMSKLRMLIVHGRGFSCGPSYLPNKLRWLDWENYPSSSLPPNFNPRNIIRLRLSESRITKLWDGQKVTR